MSAIITLDKPRRVRCDAIAHRRLFRLWGGSAEKARQLAEDPSRQRLLVADMAWALLVDRQGVKLPEDVFGMLPQSNDALVAIRTQLKALIDGYNAETRRHAACAMKFRGFY